MVHTLRRASVAPFHLESLVWRSGVRMAGRGSGHTLALGLSGLDSPGESGRKSVRKRVVRVLLISP